MSRRGCRAMAVVGTGLAVAVGGLSVAGAGAPGIQRPSGAVAKWTRLAVTDSGFNQAGMFRTSNGRLHVIWRVRMSNGMFAYHTATISARGRVLSGGTALSGWISLEGDPRLISGGPALRLVFLGGRTTNPADFYSRGSVYTEVSTGSSWTLVHASLAHHTVLNLGLAAVSRSDQTPVAAFGLNNTLYFHNGLDPNAPASGADGSVTGPVAVGLQNVALARARDGSIWMAWYEGGPQHGYWVDKILPTRGTPQRAPGSGKATSADNEPGQQVALIARPGGGLYLAYCAPTATVQCSHIDLWRVGAANAVTVPGSGTGLARRVAMVATPSGRLRLAWFDTGPSQIRTVSTDAAVARFGPVQAVPVPRSAFIFNGIQADGSTGRLDLVINILTRSAQVQFWYLQIR